jgi:acyl dehydratase
VTLHFEDLVAGAVFDLGTAAVDEEEMLAFAKQFDPQPFHVDPRAAEQSPFHGVIASGWFTGSLFMRLYVDALLADSASQGSPGCEDMRWLSPVRGGDLLTGRLTVLETRDSATRADRGTAIMRGELLRDGEPVFRVTFRGLFGRRTPLTR